MQPLIGITTSKYVNQYGWRYHKGYAANADAIVKAGGLPVFIPVGMPDDVNRAIYERLDGLLLPGGGDIDPAFYQAERDKLTNEVDRQRDEVEIQLAKWAVNDDVPVLGICRGHQVLNVALGGQLVQDIETHVKTDIKHDVRFEQPRTDTTHNVEIDADSTLAHIFGETHVAVNSLHHQAVQRVSDQLRIIARAADGIVEAVEMPGKTFVLSVQWHPEDLVNHQDSADKLFKAFVTAATTRMQADTAAR